MNENNFEPIVTENMRFRRIPLMVAAGLFSCAAIVIVWFSWHQTSFFQNFFTGDVKLTPPTESFRMYFSAASAPGAVKEIYVYDSRVQNSQVYLAGDRPHYGFHTIDAETVGFFTKPEENEVLDASSPSYVPMWLNTATKKADRFVDATGFNPSAFTSDAASDFIAFQQDTSLEQNESGIHSEVRVYNMGKQDVRIIPQAAQPLFVEQGAALLMLGEQGVYRYDIAKKDSQLVLFLPNEDLNKRTILKMTADSKKFLLLTDHSLKLFDIVNNDYARMTLASESNKAFLAAIFSTDGSRYLTANATDQENSFQVSEWSTQHDTEMSSSTISGFIPASLSLDELSTNVQTN